MKSKQRLELSWIGKDEELRLEPRILIEDPSKSQGDLGAGNLLIHGDNLLALKALEQDFAGKIKCIYIDPPYNAGSALAQYDDNLEHSIWLSLMQPRLRMLRNLLSEDGAFYAQIDDDEFAYLKVLCDEVFGRNNFINCISVKTKSAAGASGGGEDKKLKKNIEYILLYAKNRDKFSWNPILTKTNLEELIEEKREEGKQFEYRSVLVNSGERADFKVIQDGSGNDIKIFSHSNYEIKTVNQLMKLEQITEMEVYGKYFEKVFRTTNAQTSIRTRVADATSGQDGLFSIEYVPRSGKNKGLVSTSYYSGAKTDLVVWLRDTAEKDESGIFKNEQLGSYWGDLSWTGISGQGGVKFPHGKKPEALIERILTLSTNEEDIVLDSFLGSGTTAAVAHKMGRKWLGIEFGEQALTHCLPRLSAVVKGEDQTGISKSVSWKGGGGFRFCELAPSLLRQDRFGNWVIDSVYNADMLANAVAKHEGFKYAPHPETYWKQGVSNERDYIFTTTNLLTVERLDRIHDELASGESLLICAKSFQPECVDKYENITVKKIPQAILGRCEFGKENYNLNILRAVEDAAEDNDELAV